MAVRADAESAGRAGTLRSADTSHAILRRGDASIPAAARSREQGPDATSNSLEQATVGTPRNSLSARATARAPPPLSQKKNEGFPRWRGKRPPGQRGAKHIARRDPLHIRSPWLPRLFPHFNCVSVEFINLADNHSDNVSFLQFGNETF